MEELVQDLTFALEESELRIEIDEDEIGENEHSVYRKRRVRKRRPILSHVIANSKVVKLATESSSPIPESSVSYYHESLTGSDTENGFALPAIRKHRRKKSKRMEVEPAHKCNRNTGADVEMKPEKDFKEKVNQNKVESEISASEDSNDDLNGGEEGDDEMTDFYVESEAGSVCGIPSVIPWWDEDDLPSIIKKTLPNLSESAQRGFHANVNRLPGMAARSIRRGRRKYKYKKTSERIISQNDLLRPEIKNYKRRKVNDKECYDIDMSPTLPIPSTNVGHQMLINMGWTPGNGLGILHNGIRYPISASRRPKRSGLGL